MKREAGANPALPPQR